VIFFIADKDLKTFSSLFRKFYEAATIHSLASFLYSQLVYELRRASFSDSEVGYNVVGGGKVKVQVPF